MKPGLQIGFAVALALLALGTKAQNIVGDAPKLSGYHVFGANAMDAGSPSHPDITKGSLMPLYFGQYFVWSSGDVPPLSVAGPFRVRG